MKNTIKLAAISVLIVVLTAFSSKKVKTDVTRARLKGKVKSFNQIDSNFRYDATGVHASILPKVTKEFDAQGRMIGNVQYNGEGNVASKNQFIYNSKGWRIMEVRHGADGAVLSKDSNIYNDKGLVISSITFGADGVIKRHRFNKYDDKGRQTEEVIFNDSTGIKSTTSFAYDKWGDLLEKDRRDNDGKSKITFKARYDNHKRMIWKDAVSSTGDAYVYKYDKRGNQIEHDEVSQAGKVLSCMVSNYNNKKQKVEELQYDTDHKLLKRHTYKYNGIGMADTIYTYENGNLSDIQVNHISWDKNLNWISFTTTNNDTVTYVRKRQIEYY